MMILKTDLHISKIKESCKLVKKVLKTLKKEIRPGVTTLYLDNLAEEIALTNGSLPGFKGYKGFPYSICASVNEAVVHGFPSNEPLKDGDILSIDFGILKDGWYGDSAFTVEVGNAHKGAKNLIKTVEECLYMGIEQAKPYNRVGDVSNAIQSHAEAQGFSVIEGYVGHGIGRELHEQPHIPNHGIPNDGYILKPGMVIAIEPIISESDTEAIVLEDTWTTVTLNGCLSAHYEHTILITEEGNEILT